MVGHGLRGAGRCHGLDIARSGRHCGSSGDHWAKYPLGDRSIREIVGVLAAATFILVMCIWLPSGLSSVIFLIVTLAIFSMIAWSWLSVEEKTVLRSGLRTIWALP